MTLPSAIPFVILSLVAPVMAAADAQHASPVATFTQFSFHERIIIRIPRMGRDKGAAPASPVAWKEKRGPACIGANQMGGALIAGPSSVDIVLTGGQRVRAKLDGDCQPLDFYGGFYMRPGADGQICADRDSIRVRSGASCRIDSFKRLVAKR